MYLNDQTIGANGHSGPGQWINEVVVTGSMRRVDYDREMRNAVNCRHDREIHGISGVVSKSSDPAFAKDHFVIALSHYVLSGQQELVERRRQSAFQQDRLSSLTGVLEQREIRHIS